MDKVRSTSRIGVLVVQHAKFTILLCMLCFLTVIRVIIGINIPVILYLLFSFFICLICDTNEIISYMCALLPLASQFQFRYAILIGGVFIVIKKGLRKFKIVEFIPLFLIMIWELMHANMSQLTGYGYLQEFSELILISIILAYPPGNYSDGLPYRTFSYVTVFSCFINLFASIKMLGFSLNSVERLGRINVEDAYERYMGLQDPNTMSFTCIIAISSLLLLRYKNSSKSSDTLVIYILLAFVLLSQSKSALLSVVLMYFLYMLTGGKSSFSTNKVLSRISIGVIFLLTAAIGFSSSIEGFIGRFSMADLSTNRLAVFAFYFDHLSKSLSYILFGIGLYKYTSQIGRIYGEIWKLYPGLASYADNRIVYKPCHNNVLEIIVVWGIPGVILFAWFISKIIRHQKMTDKISVIPLTILMIYSLQGQLVGTGQALLGLMITLVCVDFLPKKYVDALD